MYLADYHVHSSCSPDGHVTMAELAREGIARGLDELCFTDHVDTIQWGTTQLRTDSFDWVKAQQQYADAVAQYGQRIQLKLARWGQFSVLGHLTLPVRCINEMRHKAISFQPHMAQIEEILRTIIPKGIGIECNTNRGNTPLPDADILKLYRSLGGEIVTLGSDAHVTNHLGCAIPARQELLRDCGFRYFTTFDRMKPSFQAL